MSASAVSLLHQTPIFKSLSDFDGLSYGLQRFLAMGMLFLASPLMILVMICLRLESKGSCIYRQVRVGKNGKRFVLYKLRSMYLKEDKRYKEPTKSDREGVCKKFFNDPRVTKVGKFIRKYSIDELPQLLNVVKGDMALIGPRPALPEEVEQYQYHMLQRLNVVPGITGLWQVSGRADTTFDEQIRLDLHYANKRNLFLDLQIIFSTVPVILFGRGAY